MKKIIIAVIVLGCCAFEPVTTLNGTWIFQGGIYNGKKEGAPIDYTLQRQYQDDHFDAYLLEKDSKPQKYQSGNYQLRNDTCFETETYSAQPSQLTGKTMPYHYIIRQDSLILQGKLPSGMVVEEYWKKVK